MPKSVIQILFLNTSLLITTISSWHDVFKRRGADASTVNVSQCSSNKQVSNCNTAFMTRKTKTVEPSSTGHVHDLERPQRLKRIWRNRRGIIHSNGLGGRKQSYFSKDNAPTEKGGNNRGLKAAAVGDRQKAWLLTLFMNRPGVCLLISAFHTGNWTKLKKATIVCTIVYKKDPHICSLIYTCK